LHGYCAPAAIEYAGNTVKIRFGNYELRLLHRKQPVSAIKFYG
jgi:hypothetical protein